MDKYTVSGLKGTQPHSSQCGSERTPGSSVQGQLGQPDLTDAQFHLVKAGFSLYYVGKASERVQADCTLKKGLGRKKHLDAFLGKEKIDKREGKKTEEVKAEF